MDELEAVYEGGGLEEGLFLGGGDAEVDAEEGGLVEGVFGEVGEGFLEGLGVGLARDVLAEGLHRVPGGDGFAAGVGAEEGEGLVGDRVVELALAQADVAHAAAVTAPADDVEGAVGVFGGGQELDVAADFVVFSRFRPGQGDHEAPLALVAGEQVAGHLFVALLEDEKRDQQAGEDHGLR